MREHRHHHPHPVSGELEISGDGAYTITFPKPLRDLWYVVHSDETPPPGSIQHSPPDEVVLSLHQHRNSYQATFVWDVLGTKTLIWEARP